ncbi:uncharacterized protein [Rutidosis leptorrhynchoides]|uniref:uncharacterized protein n=1 Tax=Rutidosis leptorrhynchoides TaxID=125765 RepID=UPI003A99872E
MVVTTATSSLSIFKYHHHALIKSPIHQYSLSVISSPSTTTKTRYTHHRILLRRATVNRPISATQDGIFLLSKATPAENSGQLVAADNGDGVSVLISVLLSIAFVGLSVLTIGVIYIAVTDYLQKRERDKFEKEEAEKEKKGGKKKRSRPRVGPKGFGQKVNNEDD